MEHDHQHDDHDWLGLNGQDGGRGECQRLDNADIYPMGRTKEPKSLG